MQSPWGGCHIAAAWGEWMRKCYAEPMLEDINGWGDCGARNNSNLTIYVRAVDVMTSRKTHTSVRPPAALQDIVERAVAGNADSVLLEPVPEGLEVCWITGNTGVGTVASREMGSDFDEPTKIVKSSKSDPVQLH